MTYAALDGSFRNGKVTGRALTGQAGREMDTE